MIKQFLNSLSNRKNQTLKAWMNYIFLHVRAMMFSTHSLCKRFKFVRLGNVMVGPFKSDILLIYKCFINEKKMFIYWRLHSIAILKCKQSVTIWNILKRGKKVLTILSNRSIQIWQKELDLPRMCPANPFKTKFSQ